MSGYGLTDFEGMISLWPDSIGLAYKWMLDIRSSLAISVDSSLHHHHALSSAWDEIHKQERNTEENNLLSKVGLVFWVLKEPCVVNTYCQ